MKVSAVAAVMAATGALAMGVMGTAGAQSATEPGRTVRQCTNAELAASYRAGDAATSHRYGRIVLRNVSGHACRTEGYGGLSYVGGGDGTQVGAAAERDPSTVRSVVVAPGQRVVSRVSETVAAAYPRRTCRPEHVDGFRVYLPDESRSQYVVHPTTGCRNHGVHLLSHRAYRRP